MAKNSSPKHTRTKPSRPRQSAEQTQPRLALDGYEPPLQLRLSEHTRRIGLKHIALIRQQLAAQNPQS